MLIFRCWKLQLYLIPTEYKVGHTPKDKFIPCIFAADRIQAIVKKEYLHIGVIITLLYEVRTYQQTQFISLFLLFTLNTLFQRNLK